MTLESELKRKKESLKFFYQMAQEALDAKDLEQAIEISAKGLEEAELENQDEWAEKFNALNSKVESAKEHPSLNPSIPREDITVIKGVGVAVAEKLERAGFHTLKSIAESTFAQLTLIPGIGQKTAQKIIEEASILISRKSLNDFHEQNDGANIPSTENEPKEDSESEDDELQEPIQSNASNTSKPFPWFKGKFKIRRSGVSQSTKTDNNNDYLLEKVNDEPEYEIDDDLGENGEELSIEISNQEEFNVPELETPLEQSINDTQQEMVIPPTLQEKSTLQLNQNKPKQVTTLQEKLLPSEKSLELERLIHTLRSLDFHIIEKVRLLKGLSMNSDLIALKIIHANEFLDLILILPIKLNMLKGELKISNEQVKYIPFNDKFKENGSSFRLLLDSTVNDLGKVYNAMREDLTNEGKLLSYLKRHLQVDISIETSMTKKKLFFRAGPLQYKMFIEPVLICNNDVQFLEKSIPFPYLKDVNLHIINERGVSNFLKYLERKYSLLEEHSEQKSSLLSYEESFNQFLQNGKKLSLPFIGFGFILLLLLIFQALAMLELVINIGYAMVGVYSTSLTYLYIKFFKTKLAIQTEFETPYHKRQLYIDDSGLILISDELTPELMSQFVYECIGKDSDSSFIQKLEETQAQKKLDKNILATKIKNDNLFEEREEQKVEERKDDNIAKDLLEEDQEYIHKYSSFLED